MSAGWIPNAVAFQLVWLASVGGAGRGWWWAGPLALALFAAWQIPTSRWPAADLRLMAGAAVLGFGVDTLWLRLGLMEFTTALPWPGVAPVWIVVLWMAFGLTLNHSLSSLKRRPWLAALLGLLGGPLAYYAAEHAWGAVELGPTPTVALVALAVAWAALTPLLLMLAQRATPAAVQPAAAG